MFVPFLRKPARQGHFSSKRETATITTEEAAVPISTALFPRKESWGKHGPVTMPAQAPPGVILLLHRLISVFFSFRSFHQTDAEQRGHPGSSHGISFGKQGDNRGCIDSRQRRCHADDNGCNLRILHQITIGAAAERTDQIIDNQNRR